MSIMGPLIYLKKKIQSFLEFRYAPNIRTEFCPSDFLHFLGLLGSGLANKKYLNSE